MKKFKRGKYLFGSLLVFAFVTTLLLNLKQENDTDYIKYKLQMNFNLLFDELDLGDCTFTSMDTNVATVNKDGKVTAKANGTTLVKVYNQKNNIIM